MKILITALFLVACVPAAFASTTNAPAEMKVFSAGNLLSAINGGPEDSSFAQAVIMGISVGDDKVCNGDFTLGETAEEGAVQLKMLVRKFPEASEKPAGDVMRLILETVFKCK